MFLTSYSCVFLLTRWTRAMVMYSIFSTYRCLIIDTAYMPTGFLVLRSKTFFWNFTITNTIIMTMRLPGWRTRIAIDINCTPSLRKSKTCSWKVKMCSNLVIFEVYNIVHVWPLLYGDMKQCFPEEVIFLEGLFTRRSHIPRRFVYPKKSYFSKVCLPEEEIWLPREIWLLRVNKVSYLPTTRAIHCLLYRNYTHSNDLFTIETRRATTLCVLPVGVAMGARGRGIHAIYFLGARGLGIHEVLSSWHVTFLI